MAFDHSKIDLAVEGIVRRLSPIAVILFGSAADGTADDGSDIDLIVVMETDLGMLDRCTEARMAVGRIGVPVDVLVYTPEEFRRESENAFSIVHEALTSGMIVHGTIEGFT